MVRTTLSIVLASIALSACSRDNPAYQIQTAPDPDAPEFVQGEVMVRFSAAATQDEVAARIEPWGGVVLADLGGDPDDPTALTYLNGTYRIGLPGGMPVHEAIALLEAEDDVDYVEPSYVFEAVRVPNDPDWDRLWGMRKTSAVAAWDSMTGTDAPVVAVIDTGVDYTHPDLVPNIWVNEGEVAGNGVDDDGNGYVDDVHGYDFCNNDADPADDHGHGTHCSGTIAAVGDNGRGVAGVAWSARVMGLKFLCGNGKGSLPAAVSAVRYAADNGAWLSSNSWGCRGCYAQSLHNAIAYARDKGQLFVAAAGNELTNIDTSNFYPAGYDLENIISVAASDPNDNRAWFSNYGASRVDLAAPGTNIWSTIPGGGYGDSSGTSMAAPHVSGALTLAWAYAPQATWQEMRTGLFDTVDVVPQLQGVVATGGRMNVARFVEEITPPPPAPGGVAVTQVGPGDVEVRWDVSDDATTTSYRVHARHDSGELWPVVTVEGRETQTMVLEALPSGGWHVAVSAVSRQGEGGRSAEVSVELTDNVAPARILDLRVRRDAGAPLLAEVVAASSEFSNDWGAHNALDDDTTTGWATAPTDEVTEQSLLVSLPQGARPGAISLRAADGFVELFPAGFEVRVSADGVDWLVVTREVDFVAAPGDWAVWHFPPVPARMVELRVFAPSRHASGLHHSIIGDLAVHDAPDGVALVATWSAPGDDGASGVAAEYALAAAPGMTAASTEAAPRFPAPTPGPPGTREVAHLEGLSSGTSYGVAIAARDEAGNQGEFSPIVVSATGPYPPGAVNDLGAEPLGDGNFRLTLTAPAADGVDATSGRAATYELRWSPRPIGGADWPLAQLIEGLPAPASPGEVQTLDVVGLPPAARHYFRLRAFDAGGLGGPWSNQAWADAGPDAEPPARVDDLTARFAALQSAPLPVVGEDEPMLELVDGDATTGWRAAVPADTSPERPYDLRFAFGRAEILTRVRVRPHWLYSGDFPPRLAVVVSGPDGERVVARHEIVAPPEPGDWVAIDFPPIPTSGFVLRVEQAVEAFGVASVALGDVEAAAGLPGGAGARLTWIAPGDDGWWGEALAYDLRWAGAPMDDEVTFLAGHELPTGAPVPAGGIEAVVVDGLPEHETVFFALRAVDEAGNWSELSNGPRLDMGGFPPAAVGDLMVVESGRDYVEISFTATGDDGFVGRASAYDLRYTEGLLDEASFADAIPVGMPAPGEPGFREAVRIEGLAPGATYRLGLVVEDDSGNRSGLSNVVVASTLEADPPDAVGDLRAVAAGPDQVRLFWTAPADVGPDGRPDRYEARFATTPIATEGDFLAAQLADIGGGAPLAPGLPEWRDVEALTPETGYFFALVSWDGAGNRSPVSNVAPATTLGQVPGDIDDLAATPIGVDSIELTWTATGDDGRDGNATAYDLRRSTTPILTDADFAAAMPVAMGPPIPSGAPERLLLGGLQTATTYYFALVATDDVGLRSGRALASAATPDVDPPSRVEDLSATPALSAVGLVAVMHSWTSHAYEHDLFHPRNLLDGRGDTYWASGIHSADRVETLVFDLGEVRFLDAVRIQASDNARTFPSEQAEVAVADDPDGPWHITAVEDGLVGVARAWTELGFARTRARYVRLACPAIKVTTNSRYLTISQVEILDAGAAIDLGWTAPGDAPNGDRVAAYDVRYLAGEPPADDAAWDAAEVWPGPDAVDPGLPQGVHVDGLTDGTWSFAVAAIDEAGNQGPRSLPATAVTAPARPERVDALGAVALDWARVELSWQAPNGDARSYELRRAEGPINSQNWDEAEIVAPPVPGAPGDPETLEVGGLAPEHTHVFAVRSIGPDGRPSAISNLAEVTLGEAPEVVPPSAIGDLRVTAISNRDAQLRFTAPGDDGQVGTVSGYEIAWSAAPIAGEADFDAATRRRWAEPPLAEPLRSQAATATGDALEPDGHHYFVAVRAFDNWDNKGAPSNVVEVTTPIIAPARIEDLSLDEDQETLRWTAVGDDGRGDVPGAGAPATSYEIYLGAGNPPNAFALDALVPLPGAPAPAAPSTAEAFSLPTADLADDTAHWVLVRAVDDVDARGAPSNAVVFHTPDLEAPGAFSEFTAETGGSPGQVRVAFRAPGDDGLDGRASRFEVRWSTTPFAPGGFAGATPYAGAVPVVAGGDLGSATLLGLPAEAEIWVAMRAVDNHEQAGPVSVVVSARTRDVAPGRIGDLAAAREGAAGARLAWTAPGDDGNSGRATRYEVRRHDTLITAANWDAAAALGGAPAPGEAGTAENFAVAGLSSGTTYWFAVRAVDERGQTGPVSNASSVATEDVTPPSRVGNLAAATAAQSGTLQLTWNSAGDDGASGRAERVDIRYAPVPWPGWDAAQPAASIGGVIGGAAVSHDLRGLDSEVEYAVAVETVDEDGNRGTPSNVAVAWTAAVPPGAVGQLRVEPVGRGQLRVSWLAPADDGNHAPSGAVERYELVVGEAAFAPAEFADQAQEPGPAVPASPGSPESVTLAGLEDDATYWVAVRGVDDRGSLGVVGVVVQGRTPDVDAPARVVSLAAAAPRQGGDPLVPSGAQASSELSQSWPAAAAFDGDTGTSWAALAGPDSPTLEAAFARVRRVGGVRLYAGAWADRFPRGFVVEGSTGGAWSELAIVREVTPEPDTWVALDFPPAEVSRVRFRVTASASGDDADAVVLAEVEVLPADDAPDTIVLSWVAPGDDGDRGTATAYEVRRSGTPLDPARFEDAIVTATVPPAEAGTPQTLRIEGLSETTDAWFALVAVDDAGNRSPVSNVAHAVTGGIPPAQILDLTAEADGTDAVELSWTAPGDDGDEGRATAYVLRMRVGDLSAATWGEGTSIEAPPPGPAGERESVRVEGLLPGTLYAFSVRAADEGGHEGHLSGTASALTAPAPDVVPPAAIDDLAAQAARGDGRPEPVVSVTASGAHDDFPAGAAVDGDPETAWASPVAEGQGDEVLDLTLAQVVAASEVRLRPHADFVDLFPQSLRIEGTVDGHEWTVLADVAEHVAEAGRWSSFAFPITPVRRVRVTVARAWRDPAWLVAVAEVAVFEAGDPDTVTLTFRAPGDDGDVGEASTYLLARAGAPLDDGNWDEAETAELTLEPSVAGAPQAVTREGLASGEHFFALRAVDEAGNIGAVGNSVRVVVP